MTSATSLLGPTWTAIRTHLHESSAARAERKTLERELADYTLESDRYDLEAILSRYSDAETADIRHILNGHRPS